MSDVEFNETLAVLSDEDAYADTTVNQSADSRFIQTSRSSLYISNARAKVTLRKNVQPKKGQGRRAPDPSKKHKCHLCKAALKTEKGLKKHVLTHKLQEAASRKPSPEALYAQCLSDGAQIAKALQQAAISTILTGDEFTKFADAINESANPAPSREFCEFISVCVEPLMQPLCNSKSVSPPAIRQIVRSSLHSSLANTVVREPRVNKLLEIVSAVPAQGIAEQYLQEFSRRLVNSVVNFVVHMMREAPDDPHLLSVVATKYSQDDFSKLFSQQTLHNILGSTVKGVLTRCRQYMGNPRWDDIQKVVLNKFANIGVLEAKPHEKAFWTGLLGRKNYTFVTEPLLDFFVEMAKMLCYIETDKGSISKQMVLKQVYASPSLLAQWCSVVGSGLCESDCYFLMRLMVISLCNTFGRGVLLRRTNLEADKRKQSSGGVSSVSKRGQLAR